MIVRVSGGLVAAASRSSRLVGMGFSPAVVEFYNSCHGQGGRFCSNGGGRPPRSSGSGGSTRVVKSPPASAQRAVDALGRGEDIKVSSLKQMSTIVRKVHEMVQDAKSKGKDAPVYNLCKASVPGTNLFCGASLGTPRDQMPQFGGTAVPGSKADKLPKDAEGGVNVADAFMKHLRGKGVKVEEGEMLASHLKASQNELVGAKVAGMATNPKFDPAEQPIFVSNDGYIIDGHHRWAAAISRDIRDGRMGDVKMRVIKVDMPIKEVLGVANKFTDEIGMAKKSGKERVA